MVVETTLPACRLVDTIVIVVGITLPACRLVEVIVIVVGTTFWGPARVTVCAGGAVPFRYWKTVDTEVCVVVAPGRVILAYTVLV